MATELEGLIWRARPNNEPDGRTDTYDYDAQGDLVTVKNALETTQSLFTYQGHRLVEAADILGRDYDILYADGRVIEIAKLMARYYDPGVGRFVSKDPIAKEKINNELSNASKTSPFMKDLAAAMMAELRTQNSYTYSINNPVNYSDPDGRWAKKFNIGFGSFIRIFNAYFYRYYFGFHADVDIYLTIGGAALLGFGSGVACMSKRLIYGLGGGVLAQRVGPIIAKWISKKIPRATSKDIGVDHIDDY